MIHPKDLRTKLGLTQAQMASACNAPLRTWQRWEYGTRHPSGTVQRLFDVLLDFHYSGKFDDYRREYIDR